MAFRWRTDDSESTQHKCPMNILNKAQEIVENQGHDTCNSPSDKLKK